MISVNYWGRFRKIVSRPVPQSMIFIQRSLCIHPATKYFHALVSSKMKHLDSIMSPILIFIVTWVVFLILLIFIIILKILHYSLNPVLFVGFSSQVTIIN